MDVLTKEQRRKNMQNIRSKDTSIEVALRRELWHRGYRYRKNYKGLPGSPDIVFVKYKIAIFCDSEFFHGKDWEILQERLMKGENGSYWVAKIRRNMDRDIENEQLLRLMEWTVIRFWGEEIKQDVGTCIKVIEEAIFESKLNMDT